MDDAHRSATPWRRVLGIVGGLGPHAHIELERRLLAAVEPTASEQDYPPWVLASFPSTPDRTRALLDGGPSPVPAIVRSLEALAGAADYAIIACLTAHAFFDEIAEHSPLPVLHLAEAALEDAVASHGPSVHVGVLATTGTLKGGLFATAAARMAPGVRLTSLLDLRDGEHRQEHGVMTPIYGPLVDGRRTGGRLKAGAATDPETGQPLDEPLRLAAVELAEAGAEVILTGCTEIGMALGSGPLAGTEAVLLDPLDVAVQVALAIGRGERPLPDR